MQQKMCSMLRTALVPCSRKMLMQCLMLTPQDNYYDQLDREDAAREEHESARRTQT